MIIVPNGWLLQQGPRKRGLMARGPLDEVAAAKAISADARELRAGEPRRADGWFRLDDYFDAGAFGQLVDDRGNAAARGIAHAPNRPDLKVFPFCFDSDHVKRGQAPPSLVDAFDKTC